MRIDELYAYVMADDQGREGIAAIQIEGQVVLLFGQDLARMQEFRDAAIELAQQFQKPVQLCKFSNREELENLLPPPAQQ